jgi:multidrug efflux pump subunit AcrA (membrane-fusion protein)
VEIDGRVQVLSGLHPGDRVIIAGQEKLEDGAAVKVMQPAPVRAEAAVKEGGVRL